MTKATQGPAAAPDASPAPRKGRHVFIVNAGRDMLESEIEADEFEVDSNGAYFSRDVDKPTEHVCAFVSHPCYVRLDDDGEAAALRDGGK